MTVSYEDTILSQSKVSNSSRIAVLLFQWGCSWPYDLYNGKCCWTRFDYKGFSWMTYLIASNDLAGKFKLWKKHCTKNYAIWLAKSILAYISGTRFFLNIGFVQEHSK